MNDSSNAYVPDPDVELEKKLKKLTMVNNNSFEGDTSLFSPNLIPKQKHKSKDQSEQKYERTVSTISEHYKGVLQELGEDAERQGLLKTPERAAKAMLFFTKGYRESISGENFDTCCYHQKGFIIFQVYFIYQKYSHICYCIYPQILGVSRAVQAQKISCIYFFSSYFCILVQ